jgi:hypothetical protein
MLAAAVLSLCPTLAAQGPPQSSSSQYSVDQVFFGAGGELNACSGSYCAKQSAGEIAAGNTAGSVFRAQAGFNTDRAPSLSFSVFGGPTDLGYLSQTGTAHTTGSFAVKTYLAGGYAVQIASDPPTNIFSGDQINPMTGGGTSQVGTEQFGINLAANTTGCGAPANFGAPPVQVPDNTFSFGTVAAGYGTCGNFKYNKGDVVAQSNQSSGETDYTVSFIYNISELTSSGYYSYNGVFVATSTF